MTDRSYNSMRLTTIARKITSHLAQLAGDEEFRSKRQDYNRFIHPAARRASSRIAVRYRPHLPETTFSKDEAIAYLRWLDDGGKGTIFEMRIERSRASRR